MINRQITFLSSSHGRIISKSFKEAGVQYPIIERHVNNLDAKSISEALSTPEAARYGWDTVIDIESYSLLQSV